MLVQSYQYFYSPGTTPNRQIDFIRQGSTLKAQVKALQGEEWIVLNDVAGEDITVELLSTSEKVQKFLQARQVNTTPIIETSKMNVLSPEKQNEILKSLQPFGKKKMDIVNESGGPQGLERVTHITIFDPS